MRSKRTVKSLFRGLINRFLHHFARHCFPNSIRVFIHRLRGVSIGFNTFIGKYVVLDDTEPSLISIGNNVGIALNVVILVHRRDITEYNPDKGYNDYPFLHKPVTIQDNVQIGCGTIIMPGITVGRSSIIAAGSVVTKDVPPEVLVAGCPAVTIKILSKVQTHNEHSN